jgi:hypothetical protein
LETALTSAVKATDDIATAAVGDTLVLLNRRTGTAEGWRSWMFPQIEALLAAHPGGIILFSVILPNAGTPDRETTAVIQTDLRRIGGKIRRNVVVVLGDAIWISVVRTFIRAIALISGRSREQVFATTIREGLEKVREAAGPSTASRADLEAALDACCDAIRATRVSKS